jgi:molybdopterin biosynthesis enzyme
VTATASVPTEIEDALHDRDRADDALTVDAYLGELLGLVEPLTAANCSATEPGCSVALHEGFLTAAGEVRSLTAPRSPRVGICALRPRTPRTPNHEDKVADRVPLAIAGSLAADGAVPFAPVLGTEFELSSWLDGVAGTFDLILLIADLRENAIGHLQGIALARADWSISRVRMEPADLQAWGVWRGGTPIIVIPTDLTSGIISYEMFVRPLIDHMLGVSQGLWSTAVATREWSSTPGRLQVVPVRLRMDRSGRVLLASPVHGAGPASNPVGSIEDADGIVTVDEDLTEVVAGLKLPVRWLR